MKEINIGIGLMGVTAILCGISYILNERKEKRYLQWINIMWTVIGFFMFYVAAIVVTYLKKWPLNLTLTCAGIGSLAYYFVIKAILKGSRGKKREIIDPSEEYVKYNLVAEKYYLDQDFVFVAKGLKVLVIVFVLMAIPLGVYLAKTFEMKISLKFFTQFSDVLAICLIYFIFILLLFEITSYFLGEMLDRPLEKEKEEETVLQKAKEEKNMAPLYTESKEIWKANILADFSHISKNENESNGNTDSTYKKGEYRNKSKEFLDICKKLRKHDLELTLEEKDILTDFLSGEDIIVENSNFEELAPILISYFETSIIKGKKILVLAENNLYYNFKIRGMIKKWLKEWFDKLYSKSIRNIRDFDQWFNKPQWDIVIGTQNELIKHQEAFIRKMQEEQEDIRDIIILVINENAEELAENILTLSVLTNILNTYFRVDKKKGENGAQYIILSNKASNLKESINKNLGITAKRIEIRKEKPSNLFNIIWKMDKIEKYYNKIMDGTCNCDIGISNILSYLPWARGYKGFEFINQDDFPYETYKESTKGEKSHLRERPIDRKDISTDYDSLAKYRFLSSIIKRENSKLLYIFDQNNNFPCLLEKYASLGKKEAFLNIITPDYMLRDYFIDNVEYFTNAPIYGYTPKIESDQFKVASYLKEVLTNERLVISEDDIKRELLTYKNKIGNIEEEIVNLFKDVYDIDILKHDYLTVTIKQVYNFDLKAFEEKKYFRMNSAINENNYFKWFENYEVIDTGKNVYEMVPFEHIYQRYLPEQIHSFNGNSYKIEKIDIVNKKINITPTERESVFAYRNRDRIVLNDINKMRREVFPEENSANYKLCKVLSTVDYSIKTLGYFEFKKEISMSNQAYRYINLKDTDFSYDREYKNGKILSVKIENKNIEITNFDGVALTLSILFSEVFKTMFPGNHRYIKIFTMVSEDYFDEKCTEVLRTGFKVPETLAHILPDSVEVEKSKYQNIVEENSSKHLTLYFLEDSHKDVGILQAVKDNFEDIMIIIQDYLNWLLSDNMTPRNGWNKVEIPQSEKLNFLKYGQRELSKYLSIEETSRYLNEILGPNKYTQNRETYYSIINDNKEEDEFDREYNYLKIKIKMERE